MTNTPKIESKLAFDKIRESIVDRCSTGYGRDRAGNEAVSKDPAEIERRLGLTDEMRVILMFETSFPTSGYPDSIPFLVPLRSPFSHIDLPSLVLLRTAMDTLRRILNFFSGCKDGQYPLLRDMSSSVLLFPEILRRMDEILDRYGEVRDSASEQLFSIRRAIKEKEGAVSRQDPVDPAEGPGGRSGRHGCDSLGAGGKDAYPRGFRQQEKSPGNSLRRVCFRQDFVYRTDGSSGAEQPVARVAF